ncbi:MAG TPA: alpha-amylase family glycosyl hydrolase, partial [Dermatophilaceae bacterium]|nr:alpha-amylase family glycosyl hydrolase [Dermatophilaceae bacterium]
MPRPSTRRDHPPAPGVTLVDGGAEVCVYAGHAESVDVCLFDPGDRTGASERRVPLTDRRFGYWFGFVPGMGVGQRYGLRARGPWAPHAGLRYNPSKLLLDPYARAIEGDLTWTGEVYGHRTGPDLRPEDLYHPDTRDSAPFVPRGVVLRDSFDWGADTRPNHPLSESVIYETHVRNLTMRLPGVPHELRGTYAGLAHPVTIDYLSRLGVTAVELLPIHSFVTEPEVWRRGLTNHWGYNTLGFFAPHSRYAAATDPQGVLDEFKGMVKLLHAAGIEVILDVVYNHT